uniref:collagen alpha-3(VI) chain-like n=1 Tax=Solea senegalensis TaxID=28829 RepID=UPI001CD8A5FA|nr:collagen alpha-3(VI) chain-like [Solea senegalensis]
MKSFVQKVVETLSIGENKDRVSVIQYSRDPQTHFNLNTHMEKQDVLNAIQQLNHKGGSPRHTGTALDYVREKAFADTSGSRHQEGIPQILILLSGGKSEDDVESAAVALKQDKVVPFCVGTRNADILELQMIAHNPSYSFTVLRFDDIGSIHQQLMSFVKRVPRQQPRLKSQSALGQTGSIQRDVVFLLDSSDEMQIEFQGMLGFVERMVAKLNVDDGNDRVSVVQYSRSPSADFFLNTYKTQQNVVDNVQHLRHKGGRPLNTGAALQYVKDNIFTASSGSRHQQGVPQFLVLITGGRSNDDVRKAVENLKEIGVMVFVFGIKSADILEAQTISQESSRAFFAADSSGLSQIEPLLTDTKNGETPALTPTSYDSSRRDVVFLLDGSDDSQQRFPDIQDFVARIVTELNINANNDHVAVVQYSNTAEINFDLGRYLTEDDVLKAVRGLRHKGGYPHNTGAALQYVRDHIFTSESGSRIQEGVPQILVLLSGGRSGDDIRTPVKMLKEIGIISIAIGTIHADTLELQTISREPTYALSITDYEELPSATRDVLSLMREASHHIEERVPTNGFDSKKNDVVFLIDGSYDSRNGFEEIRGFVEKVVESLNIGENRDQVAVVQYNRDATVNFYLNSYSSKNDVMSSIRTMRHKLGRPLNIGKALAFVKDNVFAASVGGRREDSVPQYLYVFSGGRSGDDVRGPAQSLKENGIKTFSIGTENADTLEMQTISLTPAHYFHVTNFNNLQSLHPSLETALKGNQETTQIPGVIDRIAELELADIVFLLDASDETQASEILVLDFVREFVKQTEIGPSKVQVALVQYSTEPTINFLLNTYSLRDAVMSHLSNVKLKGGSSLNTGIALDYVKNNVLTVSSGSRAQQGVPQILILLSGRKSDDDVLTPVDQLRKAGIVLFNIGVNNADRMELEQFAQSPKALFFIKEKSDIPLMKERLLSAIASHKGTFIPGVDFGNLPHIHQRLMNHIMQVGVEEETKNVEKKRAGRDVVFLLDGSDGTRTGFPAMQVFVQRVVETLSVDDNKDRVSVVQYSRDPAVHFYLNTYTTKGEILDTVRGLRHKGGQPLNTGAALQYLRDNVFAASAGSRLLDGVPQVLILLSGGRSYDSVDAPASALKQQGIFVIGIGRRGSDFGELQKISHDPGVALKVSEFTDLPTVQQQLQSSLETAVIDVSPESPTVLVDTAKKDIVFLLDGSDGTRNAFPAMLDFVEKVVEKLKVGANKDRVSVVQYSRDAEAHFHLNTYTTKEDIVDSVRGLRHRGGRPLNTGAALQYARDNVFTNSSGSRRLQGVPQMLILLNGGRSFDSVDAPASALKKQGIFVIGIGARGSDVGELQRISYDPSVALKVSEFTDLPSVQEQLSSVMSTVLVRATAMTPTVTVEKKPTGRDVVFLLDGSDDTRTGFPAMQDFVQRVVETLSVDDNKDRVSVVQYSRDPAVHFYLNTYTTKGEILDTVRGLRHKGGRPLNTGAALQYLRDNVFATSAGSRRLDGVPQVLILLSGGRSYDSVDAPASALKQQGIFVIGIGRRGSDFGELQKISHDPGVALKVSEFTDLPTVQQQLQSSLETAVIDVSPESPTVLVDTAKKDIVFLLDGSDGTRNAFPAMLDFVEKVVEKLKVGEMSKNSSPL